MPLSVANIANNTAHVTLAYGGETAAIDYYPGRVTEKAIAVLNSFSGMTQATMEQGFKDFNETLAHLIKGWDVLNDDGSMFPIDATRLAELPIAFRVQVLSAIMQDIRPEALASPS